MVGGGGAPAARRRRARRAPRVGCCAPRCGRGSRARRTLCNASSPKPAGELHHASLKVWLREHKIDKNFKNELLRNTFSDPKLPRDSLRYLAATASLTQQRQDWFSKRLRDLEAAENKHAELTTSTPLRQRIEDLKRKQEAQNRRNEINRKRRNAEDRRFSLFNNGTGRWWQ